MKKNIYWIFIFFLIFLLLWNIKYLFFNKIECDVVFNIDENEIIINNNSNNIIIEKPKNKEFNINDKICYEKKNGKYVYSNTILNHASIDKSFYIFCIVFLIISIILGLIVKKSLYFTGYFILIMFSLILVTVYSSWFLILFPLIPISIALLMNKKGKKK